MSDSTSARYRREPLTLDERITQMERRLSALERSPRASATGIDSGQLTINGGDIVIQDASGVEVVRITQGAGTQPGIKFSPEGAASTHVAKMYSVDSSEIDATLQTIMKTEIRTDPGDVLDGGFVHIYQYGIRAGFFNDSTGETSYWEAGFINGVDATLHIVGRWLDNFQVDTTEAIYPGSFGVSAGFSSWTLTYAASFATQVAPIIGLLNSAGALSWNLTAQSASSFTVAWTGALAKTINMWNIRL